MSIDVVNKHQYYMSIDIVNKHQYYMSIVYQIFITFWTNQGPNLQTILRNILFLILYIL